VGEGFLAIIFLLCSLVSGKKSWMVVDLQRTVGAGRDGRGSCGVGVLRSLVWALGGGGGVSWRRSKVGVLSMS
jgi:hypothetical protein